MFAVHVSLPLLFAVVLLSPTPSFAQLNVISEPRTSLRKLICAASATPLPALF